MARVPRHLAHRPVGAILRFCVLAARLHQSCSRTANSRCGSAIPFSSCSPRSSNCGTPGVARVAIAATALCSVCAAADYLVQFMRTKRAQAAGGWTT